MKMKRARIVDLLSTPDFNRKVCVKGWVRTRRGNKNISFIELNDGSTVHGIQIVVNVVKLGEDSLKSITTGACIAINGLLVKSKGEGQKVEIQADEIEIYGIADPSVYPLQKKWHSLEFLREIAYLRPRTNTFGCILRIRHHLAYAIHKYFNKQGFFYFHTPIITSSDAEGAGSMFQITDLDIANCPKTKDGEVDYTRDFFGCSTNLTVSGQLEGELGALALGGIYTFGPIFRAEKSNTPRHLAEFWMIEPEIAFYDINDNMDLAEDFLKYIISYAMKYCKDDIEFLNNTYNNELIEHLNFVLSNRFVRLAYSEGIRILEQSNEEFEFPIYWGIDLQSEHERYLVEKYFKCPVIMTNYPKDIKSFYMKQNDDGRTVRGMDVLFPRIGEIIGGSERESDHQKLLKRIKELNMSMDNLWWYLDTRRFGTAPHSGFGLGFERLVLFVTGMQNIRDVIPFPRTPKNAEF
ncbi:MAG: asparagine--tRNA ligase [Candidatus Azobacteroides pseudotrichonymphae]|jgi:asparaginyl-tRNA synthetase|uniref:Asparagine--tRNA ligase n=1 Tax=Azobacteroides pseudotrichonymphae genomovar. CFP2 TaxID=511995 RepID=SYN_AZOPC|nr:asparagine--tRNA ligase [Candidatus Azobacteroides pseudotrichonymphae]B6YRL1.1 RecName: Full=Asparagine--tRNA ligase; AltName: Full=Asparaginyl-tRNA synthetase; Short=AsnRS [Candidatus Azobacteroides pseudotrichonymphae genomovar. CFP2]BAG83833.1 asparaginyl-tRNA synthetase [Candidatus Azobacteroides pseudotrichonymphae genomovar. CFP2]GMO36375.1 MAG: asparagine--tRNA ligase [Candidatus Azobacteroides pseudotrichonymphae]